MNGPLAAIANGTTEEAEAKTLDALKRTERLKRRARREVADEERPASPALRLLSDAELDARPAAQWLVQDLILESSLGLIVGEPGSGKTFLCLDLALSVASGQTRWLGRPLHKHGAVVYVAAEGQGRFKYRKNVWKQERRVSRDLPFYTLPHAVDLRDPILMASFLKAIEVWSPVLVVFDTLSRCIPGAEENSAKELGEAITACNLIQLATGATVQLLHHPRKDGLSSRGSGAGLGAVESELWTKKGSDKGLFTLTCGKQKEGDDDVTIELKRKIVELDGVYEYGEPVTSCVIELATPQDVAKAFSSLERRILECVQNHPNIKKGDVAKRVGAKKKTVDTAIDLLVRDGRLSETAKGKAKLLTFVSFMVQPGSLAF